MISDKTHVLVFKDKSKMEVTAKQADSITELSSDPKIRGFDVDGKFIAFDHIAKVLSIAEYYEQYPSSKVEPGRAYLEPPTDLQDIVNKFDWASTVFNFISMFELVTLTHEQLSHCKTDQDFREFCIKHKALTRNGVVTTGVYADDKGKTQRVPFAYPLFLEVWHYIQGKRRNLDDAKEMTWEEIENGLAGVSDQLNKINPSKWKKALEKSLQSTEIGTVGKELLQQFLQRAPNASKEYKPAYKTMLEYYKAHPEEATPEKLAIASPISYR